MIYCYTYPKFLDCKYIDFPSLGEIYLELILKKVRLCAFLALFLYPKMKYYE
jgi:hypothetical protein